MDDTFTARVRQAVEVHMADADPNLREVFLERFDLYAPDAIDLLSELYGSRDDFASQIVAIFQSLAQGYLERRPELHKLDSYREGDPFWFQSNRMVGAFCYVDLFAGTFDGLRERINYLSELGITYLHLMPVFRTREGPDDGGYAISTYRETKSHLGTINDLRRLADALRYSGISLVLDFVFNHTGSNHTWAERAKAGDAKYRDSYHIFPDRTLPDQYEQHLREVFPEEHPGAFTYHEEVNGWVWTTFHSYQWDLNYRSPAVFREMLQEMLFLANLGAEGIRLDAVAFLWKEMGTSCENLPESHTIIQAYNRLIRIAAPGTFFKSEAIVHPDDVVEYFGTGERAGLEANIGYNPLLMTEIWEPLATRHTHLLTYSMKHRYNVLPPGTAWVNYVRSHDDLIWNFADEDAQKLGIDGGIHRDFLSRFYTGAVDESFALGRPFQFNPRTGDVRVSGTTASLAGLEKALRDQDRYAVDLALRRILLLYSIVLSMGGIPLLNLGDEIGMLNDYSYRDDPGKASDSRWLHRVPFDWDRAGRRHDPTSIPGRIYFPLKKMISIRKDLPAFSAGTYTEILDTNNMALFGYRKPGAEDESGVMCICNFRAEPQVISAETLAQWMPEGPCLELLAGLHLRRGEGISLEPYGVVWIKSLL
ncbi:MAG: amylosucrase [Chloroflexi bacterium]|nr:amylosucrase [Chloroflexota bacterium]